MTSSPEGKSPLLSDIELRPDGWQRFERAVDAAIKSGPKHKVGKRKAKASLRGRPRKNEKGPATEPGR